MKPFSSEGKLPSVKMSCLETTPKIVLSLTVALVFTILPLCYYPLLGSLFVWKNSTSIPPSPSHPLPHYGEHPMNSSSSSTTTTRVVKQCNIFRGEWVPNPRAPYYTNDTCWPKIAEHQNCMKYGRPDTDFMKWRWKPNDCELSIFNPAQFLEIVRGKSMAFVGDSVGRNQMQSLMCLLSRVTDPVDISPTPDEKFKRWSYPTHNFTIASFWSPFLVTSQESDPLGPTLTGLFDLYLDEPDPNWTTQVRDFDYVMISAGHWFYRPAMYFKNRRLVGCHYCLRPNANNLTMYYGYRHAFRTAFRVLNAMTGFKGMTFLRTFAPSHFENGDWNKGGDCVRKKPFRNNETRLDEVALEMYMAQVEEFRAAATEGDKKGLRFRLMDTTEAMWLRPDGHPSKYGHPLGANVTLYNDCVHWCLPGPIDTWNDFMLHMLKMEGGKRGSKGRVGV